MKMCAWCDGAIFGGDDSHSLKDTTGDVFFFHPQCYNEFKQWFGGRT